MSQCSDMPICDFCALFDWNSAFDKDGVNVASGLCFKHRKMVDASGGCRDFICRMCAKAEFCTSYKAADGSCGGYFEGESLHPMCVRCRYLKEDKMKSE